MELINHASTIREMFSASFAVCGLLGLMSQSISDAVPPPFLDHSKMATAVEESRFYLDKALTIFIRHRTSSGRKECTEPASRIPQVAKFFV